MVGEALMHPHTLHALAAASSLAAALTVLEQRAKDALKDAEAGNTADRDIPLSSPAWGRRHALGGHGDPTASIALGAWAPGGPEPHAALLGDLMRQLDHMVAEGNLPGAPGQDPLDRIRQAIPGMRPHVAGRTTQALDHLDGQARRRLQLPPDLTAVSGQCPACRTRGVLYATGGWVVCRATGCTCTGDGCGCGMPVRAEGVGHIWTADAFATRAVSV